MFRAARRAALPSALFAAALLTGGCDDQRGPVTPASTGVLDGQSVFESAAFIASTFEMINDVAEEVLEAFETSAPTPIILTGCNTGTALITDNGDSDPATFRVTFSLYTTACRDLIPLVIATDPDLGGAMIITIVETSPGLSYTVELPYNGAINQPVGITVQLPSEIGLEFGVSSPFGPITYELDRPRGTAGALLQMRGTVRWEDRANGFNVVNELVLAYEMDESESPIHEKFPVGAYQIAAWAQGAAGFPVNVGFEGDGIVVYNVEGLSCRADLSTGFNPCAGQN